MPFRAPIDIQEGAEFPLPVQRKHEHFLRFTGFR